MATPSTLYRGFSSFEFQARKSFTLTGVELVKLDLLQHMYTKYGGRVMMPSFGSQIPDMVFEPLTPETVDIIKSEVYRIVEYDPRVELLEIEDRVDVDNNAVTIAAKLLFVELNLVDNLELNIGFEG